ncbi:sigma 54-interacting transcriptional regulator [Mucilaginibacter sp. OK283]|uniref:sigma 54-interacting transcriptional regulator n=1 Tax=Mucilaginibacter sp. OK283 TaxID=1881049 RepID=UPI001C436543|nr:sigma 54-interacting transcriptional regulator [Mucilaginibacter sp. OK283]
MQKLNENGLENAKADMNPTPSGSILQKNFIMKAFIDDKKENYSNFVPELRKRIAAVRERNDLLNLLATSMLRLNEFTSVSIHSVDHHTNTYFPFFFNQKTSGRNLSEFKALSNARAPLDDIIVRDAILADKSFVVSLNDIVKSESIPFWLQVNYDYGLREVLVTPLKIKNGMLGICYFWSKKAGSFGERFIHVIDHLSTELAYAVSNTIIHEMLDPRGWINELLLTFSHDLSEVRTREGLNSVIERDLKNLFHFDEFLITAIAPENRNECIFLTSLTSHPDLLDWIRANLASEGIWDQAADTTIPVIINVENFEFDCAPPCLNSADVEKGGEIMLKILSEGNEPNFGLILISYRQNVFDPADRQIIQCISRHLSTAISNILVNENLERKEKQNALLLSFSHDIAAVRNKDDLTMAIEKAVSQLSNISRFVIRGINEDEKTMSLFLFDHHVKRAIEELGHHFVLDAVYPIADGISDAVLAGNETIVYKLQDWIDSGKAPSYFHFWRSMDVEKCVATPLKTGTRKLGIFWVDSDEPDVEMIDSMCAQISIAMSNIIANEQLIKYRQQLEVENEHLQEQIRSIYNFSDIIGTSAPMQRVYQLMSLVAHSNATVLIQGETGTGKELIARGIHESSPRKNKLMVKVNCAALPVTLIESELFGYERGAFTGAFERRIGKFELAHNGTLFLDEIGELPLEVQVKLLRVIQEREFERLGGKVSIKVDVRIIAATNRNLFAEVGAGRFRSDLYYRLNVFPILIPPLRERREDIPFLAHFFLTRYNKNHFCKVTGISGAVKNELKAYNWPGNVRELEHMIERSVLLSNSKILNEIYLPDVNEQHDIGQAQVITNLADVEKQHINDVLRRCGGKISGKGGAAALLKLPASTLNSKMRKLGIVKNPTIE